MVIYLKQLIYSTVIALLSLIGLFQTESYALEALNNVRTSIPLNIGWSFKYEPKESQNEFIRRDFNDINWSTVSIPHTWNAIDGQSIGMTYARGRGVYRLKFNPPVITKDQQSWIEFNGVSLAAEVWLNGVFLGRHDGGFARFRFNASKAIQAGQKNILTVVADNSNPTEDSFTKNIIPFSGDFNMLGGIYRNVSLILTNPIHIDLSDDGSIGSSMTSQDVTRKSATLLVKSRVANTTSDAETIKIRSKLISKNGQVVLKNDSEISIKPDSIADFTQEMVLKNPHLWEGVKDPYLYSLQIELLNTKGKKIDQIMYKVGLRDIQIDPQKGFILNGKSYPLYGVCKHQDFKDKGWATSAADRKLDMDIIRELGANTVRFSHYQHDQSVYDLADEYGLIVYPELALVDTPVPSEKLEIIPAEILVNAKQQFRELIKQNYNHASIPFWGIANEIGFVTKYSPKVEKQVGSFLNSLREESKKIDPYRPTIQADVGDSRPSFSKEDGLAAMNRYYGWYNVNMGRLMAEIKEIKGRRPNQPIGLSEYGFGSSITQHTDDPRAIFSENLVTFSRDANADFMPEEYESLAHERSWKNIKSEPLLFGTWVWNMFDFSAIGRKEGNFLADGLSTNNKGLVTFDRQTKKDAFYFYKSQWNPEPLVHITSKRFVDRNYPVIEAKVYTNAKYTDLSASLNGTSIKELPICDETICRWVNLKLRPGVNSFRVEAKFGNKKLADSASWILQDQSGAFRIRVGSFIPFIGDNGVRYGSDTFLAGDSYQTSSATGNKNQLPPAEGFEISKELPHFRTFYRQNAKVNEPVSVPAELYRNYREGTFHYDIPATPGKHEVVLSFFEPDKTAKKGSRVFNVSINGKKIEENLDIFTVSGEASKKAVVRRYEIINDESSIKLSFEPIIGKAILSGIEIY